MIIYTSNISSRLQYIVSVLFHQQAVLTTNIAAFKNYKQQKINYSIEKITGDELWIQPHQLLFENTIVPQKTQGFKWQNLPVFFKTSGDIPFDFFATSFYLLSRYEEYLPYEKDVYGRFAHTAGIAHRLNFLHLPLINLWLKKIEQQLQEKGNHYSENIIAPPTETIIRHQGKFFPTYDIDIAYNYKGKGFLRNAASLVSVILKGNMQKVKECVQVFTAFKKDPFNVYEWLQQLHKKYQLQPAYFFLVAAKAKGYDKNIRRNSNILKELVQAEVQKRSVIGIHPSWQSHTDSLLLKNEIQFIENLVRQPVTHSRQHYIKLDLPVTYRRLLENGIRHEFSMGYGSINGFRASYCLPFAWYDLAAEKQTELIVYPFCYMDANAIFEENLQPEEAAKQLQQYFDIVKSVDGWMITIFHNHFLTQQTEWIEWRNMYKSFLERNFP